MKMDALKSSARDAFLTSADFSADEVCVNKRLLASYCHAGFFELRVIQNFKEQL